MDWPATARAINHPIRTVICNILDAKGEIVRDKGKPVEVARNFPDDADLDATLAKESLVFLRLGLSISVWHDFSLEDSLRMVYTSY